MKRLTFVFSRLVQTLLVLLVVATILFLIFRLMPGDPLVAYLDPTFTEEMAQALRRQFGLDRPLHIQYLVFLRNTVQGEFGHSFFTREPVARVIWTVLPNTLALTLAALVLAYALGVVAGAVLAARRGTPLEHWGIPLVLATRAAPEFWVGMLALAVFSFSLRWFPFGGATSPGSLYPSIWAQLFSLDFLHHLALPALTLALYLQGLPTLLMRNAMLEVMDEDFITFCRMRGLPERTILLRHAARNALLPVVTAFALGIGYSIGGNVIIETVFSWPGLGRTLVRAVAAKDYPVAQAAFLMIAAVMIAMNFAADLLYGLLDPRVSDERR
ncbi:MAG: ABC transporter permease [Armatimonadota bacterium]|nr:ABC transporter permease [Armatimonadota bacterium]MDR7450705.1 ABC transporter permease [Armatimonadota bacterium]MDR7466061.1 ABC transporter permease [Armatimonadota bacterium]MDR7493902.1 ABC transporter permease [Armatimonadota bacterium]MDR7504007.1 ABC transporter permease [Armatimonadota bacterium]